jgi:hypothetical protein
MYPYIGNILLCKMYHTASNRIIKFCGSNFRKTFNLFTHSIKPPCVTEETNFTLLGVERFTGYCINFPPLETQKRHESGGREIYTCRDRYRQSSRLAAFQHGRKDKLDRKRRMTDVARQEKADDICCSHIFPLRQIRTDIETESHTIQ